MGTGTSARRHRESQPWALSRLPPGASGAAHERAVIMGTPLAFTSCAPFLLSAVPVYPDAQ
jgi:hypothetical protein